ncbi:hypothetical protein EJB05_05567, partial [Eragrostis curvula]
GAGAGSLKIYGPKRNVYSELLRSVSGSGRTTCFVNQKGTNFFGHPPAFRDSSPSSSSSPRPVRSPPHPTHQSPVRARNLHAPPPRRNRPPPTCPWGLACQAAMQVAGGGGGGGGDAADMRGRHRIQAELKKLEQEARFLEEELEELEKTDKVSSALQQFLVTIESKADPLLPVTTGPSNQSWDRWFEGPQDLRRCKCWFL